MSITEIPATFSLADVEILERKTTYHGVVFSFDVLHLKHKGFSGSWIGPLTRELMVRKHAVAVLPYDPVLDTIITVEQFRIGALAAGRTPWLIEIVAGLIDEGESREEVARRETQEETGCTARHLEHIYDFLPSPGGCNETVTLFCAEVDSTAALPICGLAEEHEDIRVRVMPYAEALAWLDSGAIDNAVTLIALNWLARHRNALRQRWGHE